MSVANRLVHEESGAAAVEMAFALPVLIAMIWIFVQLAQVYRAVAGIQHGLGEGARYATLCTPTTLGCTSPSASSIKTKIQASVYGIGPGTFTVPDPQAGTSGTGAYYDLTVNYTQPTDLLFVPGPTINVSRSKRVWIAAT
jgi:Flp pilus assembly protein TadG